MNISLSNILFVLIVFQLLFLSLYLFIQKKGKRVSNLLLGCFFLSIALNLLDVFLLMTGVYSSHPYLAGWGSCLPLLFGPFIYLYTQSVLKKDFSLDSKTGYHFLPFIILFLCTEFYLLTQPRFVRERIISNTVEPHLPKIVFIVSSLIFIQFLVYAVLSLRLVSRYKKEASQHFSNSRQIDTSWLSSTISFFIMIIVLSIINGLLGQTMLATYYLIVFNILVAAVLIYVIVVLLKALQKPYFFSFPEVAGARETSNSPLKTEIAEAERIERKKIAEKVSNHMLEKKPYLEPELTLEQLASQLSVRPRILSQAINEILGQNFFDFINRHRIQEATRLLTRPKDSKLTILEVLYEVGFNSKSSFNSLFKKYTGLTPTEFRKNQSAEGSSTLQ
jgi:AraC-like DNA-binding protein